jgi:hypothetical protein
MTNPFDDPRLLVSRDQAARVLAEYVESGHLTQGIYEEAIKRWPNQG